MNIKKFIYLLLLFSLFFAKKISKKQKQIINISFAINNKYTYNILIPLISLCENGNKDTIYYIYILVGENFEQKNIQFISGLEKIYFNCFIHFKNLGKDFQNVYKSFLDESAYYRLKLPILSPDNNRVIYLDSDTIILKDLIEFYTLNFNGNYILAKLDKYPDALDNLLFINNNINDGVMLMDLYNLRKYGYVDKFLDYIKNHNDMKYLFRHDQTLINYICHDKIGILRQKYHMWPYQKEIDLINDNKKLRIPYNIDELINDYYDATIVHFPGGFKYKEIKRNTTYYYIRYEEYYIKSNNLKSILLNDNISKFLNNHFYKFYFFYYLFKFIFR